MEERTYPVDCVCGKEGLTNEWTYTKHVESKAHQEFLMSQGEVLPAELRAIIADKDTNPLYLGKMVRQVFSKLGWPNSRHPGTVREFMVQYGIPMFDLPAGRYGQGEGDIRRQQMIKEYVNKNG